MSGGEHAQLRPIRVVAGSGRECVAAGPVQPGQHQDIRPDGKAVERGAQRRVDDDPRRRGALVALMRRVRRSTSVDRTWPIGRTVNTPPLTWWSQSETAGAWR